MVVILPARVALLCPEECRCEKERNFVNCSDAELQNIPLIPPTHFGGLVLDGNNIRYFEKDSFVSRGLVELRISKALLNYSEISQSIRIIIICNYLYIWYSQKCHPYHNYHMQQGHANCSHYAQP
jgi:hypothetical protein